MFNAERPSRLRARGPCYLFRCHLSPAPPPILLVSARLVPCLLLPLVPLFSSNPEPGRSPPLLSTLLTGTIHRPLRFGQDSTLNPFCTMWRPFSVILRDATSKPTQPLLRGRLFFLPPPYPFSGFFSSQPIRAAGITHATYHATSKGTKSHRTIDKKSSAGERQRRANEVG